MATNPLGRSPSPVTFPNLLSTFDRNTLASAVEVLVAVLDAMDGDPDDENAADAEDDFSLSPEAAAFAARSGPGCKISDPREEDDPSGLCDEDGINTVFLGRWNEGPGCPISDPGGSGYGGY